MKRLLGLTAVVLALGASGQASAQTTYTGPIITDASGANCKPRLSNQEGAYVFRDLFAGLTVSNTFTGGTMQFFCPVSRRNTSIYGVDPGSIDRVLMSSIRLNVFDGTSSGGISCSAYVKPRSGSVYWSSTRYACGTVNGCTSAPVSSFTGTSELYWSNPFGASQILNKGAANVGYQCIVPKNSSIVWSRAVFSPNP